MSGGVVSDERPQSVTILCANCGELVEVADVAALVSALHTANDCTLSPLVVHRAE